MCEKPDPIRENLMFFFENIRIQYHKKFNSNNLGLFDDEDPYD